MPEEVTVRDVMSRDFVGVSEGDPVDDVIDVMVDENAASVMVLRGNDPVGTVTERDLLSFVADEGSIGGARINDVMRAPPDPINVGDDIATVLAQLTNQQVKQLPVVNGEQELVGVVSQSDVIAASASLLSADRGPAEEGVGSPDEVAVRPGTSSRESFSTRSEATASGEFSTQGVCESCGSLTHELENVNGQLICPECRSVT